MDTSNQIHAKPDRKDYRLILKIIAGGLVVFLLAFNPSTCRKACKSDMHEARVLLTVDSYVRAGDTNGLQKYLDHQLQRDLYGIAIARSFYVRPSGSIDVAGDIVDYFDKYRGGKVEMDSFSNSEDFNKHIRIIAEEVRRGRSNSVVKAALRPATDSH